MLPAVLLPASKVQAVRCLKAKFQEPRESGGDSGPPKGQHLEDEGLLPQGCAWGTRVQRAFQGREEALETVRKATCCAAPVSQGVGVFFFLSSGWNFTMNLQLLGLCLVFSLTLILGSAHRQDTHIALVLETRRVLQRLPVVLDSVNLKVSSQEGRQKGPSLTELCQGQVPQTASSSLFIP